MKCYFSLAQQFRTQDEPAYCGVSTLVMVLNALNVDSGKIWKGPWRWYHEDMLDCCLPLEKVRESGISLPAWICLAKCNGAQIKRFLPGGGTLDEFRDLVRSSSKQASSDQALVLSYSRKHLQQTGDGHFSPMGGYCEEEDALLILDVARFKYPAHWVKVEDAWKAMQLPDPSTGRPRGCVLLAPSTLNSTIVFSFRTRAEDWRALRGFLSTLRDKLTKPNALCTDPTCVSGECAMLKDESLSMKERVVRCFFSCLPPQLQGILASIDNGEAFGSLPYRPRDHELAMESIKSELESLETMRVVREALEALSLKSQDPLLSCALLLALPSELLGGLNRVAFAELQDVSMCSQLVRDEVGTLTRQIRTMLDPEDSSIDGLTMSCFELSTCERADEGPKAA